MENGVAALGDLLATTLPLEREAMGRWNDFRSAPLGRSPWAMQERVFSKQVLHFSSDKLYFECIGQDAGIRCENGSVTDPPRFLHAPNPVRNAQILLAPSITRTLSLDPSVFPEPPRMRHRTCSIDIWNNVVELYSLLELSDPADKLRALSNIAIGLCEMLRLLDQSADYLAGIWGSFGVQGLLWSPLEQSKPWSEYDYRAPSWSWASVDGPVSFYQTELEDLRVIGRFRNYHMEVLDDRNPYGSVTDGFVYVEAPWLYLIQALQVLGSGEGDEIRLMPQNPLRVGFNAKSSFPARFDRMNCHPSLFAKMVRPAYLFALVLAVLENKDDGTLRRAYGLIFTPDVNGTHPRGMRRVGFYEQDGASLEKGVIFLEMERNEFMLV